MAAIFYRIVAESIRELVSFFGTINRELAALNTTLSSSQGRIAVEADGEVE